MVVRKRIVVSGRVQGVGFRPAVYRLACRLGLTGLVYNDTKGLSIELQGTEHLIAEFLERLDGGPDLPAAAQIDSCEVVEAAVVEGETEFVIKASVSQGRPTSQVTADIATCTDCLREMRDENDFRYRYPFINCTNCGPRYSIVRTIPYDRCNTTMSAFRMCERCTAQYEDAADRRFHAQPVACAADGPKIRLTDNAGRTLKTNSEDVIAEAARLLKAGRIVAVKGVGGFHLAVDALNNDAVLRLRLRKKRDHKPFAMMAQSPAVIEKYARLDAPTEKILKGPESPIVLLPKKPDSSIAEAVAPGVNTFGFMLCYAPLHHLLFEQAIKVLVMTSGNISDEPLICRNDDAIHRLGGVADAFLMHDRDIYRQVDDSIVHFIDGQAVLLRRSRGYVPQPFYADTHLDQDIFAAGADLKNTFCFARDNQFIVSEHIGDLADAEVYRHYAGSVEHLRRLFEVEPKVVICDLHPGYLSREYALSMRPQRLIEVQHHWAHAASVLAEHRMEGPVIGLVCDGTGYGTDGAIWGCECLIASLQRFERFGHLRYYPLAGGDKAAKQAIRPALALLTQACGADLEPRQYQWLLEKIEPDQAKRIILAEQLDKRINTVPTSSLGRVFDAVAAMTGLGTYNYFDGQLPMALEAIIEPGIDEEYEFELADGLDGAVLLDLQKAIRQIVRDVCHNVAPGIVAAKFHNCLAAGLCTLARKAGQATSLKTVALSGGVFCNRYLSNRLIRLLRNDGFEVLFNRRVPANDGGLSLGQAAIAAKLVARLQPRRMHVTFVGKK